MGRDRTCVGWREWVELPELGAAPVKAKLDTGARTSALHAFNVTPFERNGRQWVRFAVHPAQRSSAGAVTAEAPLADRRAVRSSDGRADVRPVIVTDIVLGGLRFPIELTLARRDAMGFRMLVGRAALRRRFVVDPGRSFLTGHPDQWKART